ncbi:class I SAM-dependent methyltransferase [Candidatus Woesearchaeota archaeon]|nr:class I SAM-dependent methyltransferase [Candidatus Woesearchaeota archaeon]
MKKRPETIENRWDILYRDYPEVYDEFSSFKYKPAWIEVIAKTFDLKGKVIADIGSGSGKSTFGLAKHAKFVIGIEPEDAMRNLAIKKAKKNKIKNIEFKKGWAKKIPLKKDSVDIVTGVTLVGLETPENLRKFVKEASRVVKKGGYIITVNIPPGWYGGNLVPVILGKKRASETELIVDKNFKKLNFKHKDFYSIQDYKSVNNIVRTYGFIFGKKAIEYIKKHKITKIKWKLRIFYKKV